VRWDTLAAVLNDAHPVLGERLKSFIPNDTPLLAAAQIPFAQKESQTEHLLFVGDAAGVTAPLCGNGQMLALQSAMQLASVIHAYPRRIEENHIHQIKCEWQRVWHQSFSRRIRFSRGLQPLVMYPVFSRWLWYGLSCFPSGLQLLFRLTHGNPLPLEKPPDCFYRNSA